MTGEVVDLSGTLEPVRDQGNRGTCFAFAVTAAHEVARLTHRGGDAERLSEELLYWACKQVDGDHASGTSAESAEQALRETGQPRSDAWPYEPGRDDACADYQPPETALDPAGLRHAQLRVVPSDPSVLKEAIRQGQVVVLGLALWDEFFGAQGDVLGAPVPTQLIGDLHAVALVGFDADEGSLLIRNSWDEGWGVAGHGRLAEAALPVVCVGSWVVVDEIDPG